MYTRNLGPEYENEKENWRILTSKKFMQGFKKPTIMETVQLSKLRWFGHVQRMEEKEFPKDYIYEIGNNKTEK
jgi:hypothetical protein